MRTLIPGAILMVALAGTSHGQTPVLHTGGVSTNVVAVLEQPPIIKQNAHVAVKLAWKANPSAHGFGVIRFGTTGPSLFFTASGYWRFIKPGQTPTLEDLANTLDGQGQYAACFRIYTAAGGAGFAGDYNAVWPGVILSQKDFQTAFCVLSGVNLEVVSLSHNTAFSGSLLLVR